MTRSKCAPSSVQRLPIFHRRIPVCAFRRLRTAFEEFVGLLIRRDHAGARAAFDRHVADRHTAFHRQLADRLTREFNGVAGAARSADLADDGEDNIFRGDARRQRAIDLHQHVLGFFLNQRLRRQHMFDFGRADAVSERTECAMRRSVAIAAHDGRARQGEALFRPDDVDDALTLVELIVIFEAEQLGVLSEVRDLRGALRVGVRLGAVGRRHVMIDDQQRLLRRMDLAARRAQTFKRLWRGHFMDEVTVDVEQAGAVSRIIDQMIVPDFVVERARFHVREP